MSDLDATDRQGIGQDSGFGILIRVHVGIDGLDFDQAIGQGKRRFEPRQIL